MNSFWVSPLCVDTPTRTHAIFQAKNETRTGPMPSRHLREDNNDCTILALGFVSLPRADFFVTCLSTPRSKFGLSRTADEATISVATKPEVEIYMKLSSRALGISILVGCSLVGVKSTKAYQIGCNTIESEGNSDCIQQWSACRQSGTSTTTCNQQKAQCFADVQELYEECERGTPPPPGGGGVPTSPSEPPGNVSDPPPPPPPPPPTPDPEMVQLVRRPTTRYLEYLSLRLNAPRIDTHLQ
jgi:hypothetical protein